MPVGRGLRLHLPLRGNSRPILFVADRHGVAQAAVSPDHTHVEPFKFDEDAVYVAVGIPTLPAVVL